MLDPANFGRRSIIALMLLVAPAAHALSPPNPNLNTPWDVDPASPGNQTSAPGIAAQSVEAVEAAFNNGRRQEELQLGLSLNALGSIDLPSQSVWDVMTPSEKAFMIVNQERMARAGINYPNHGTVLGLPFEAVESHLNKLAQDYADYMVDNDFWAHSVPAGVTAAPFAGTNAFTRISGHPVLGTGAGTAGANCQQFIARAENLGVSVSTVSNQPVPTLIVESAIYDWLYVDAGSNWGHREAMLLQDQTLTGLPWGFNNDRGSAVTEGFMGIGIAGRGDGSYTVFNGNVYPSQWAVVWVMMDPSADPGCNFGVPVTKDLPNNTWQLISLPATPPPGADTVADIFGDDIPGVYGTQWQVFGFDELDAATGRYVDPGPDGVLEQGKGYWIIQATGNPVTLDMPPGSSITPVASLAQCSAQFPLGCFSYSLKARGQLQWNLLGNPFYTRPSVDNLRVSTTVGVCADTDGCTMNEAADPDGANVQHNEFWNYDGTTYVKVGPGGQLQPWAGYWNPVLSGAVNTNATFHIPRN